MGTRRDSYETVFVNKIPDKLEEGILYVSRQYDYTVHKCMCGCGQIVGIPLEKGQWQWCSTGNISFVRSVANMYQDCKSHYFLKNGKVVWY